jgi:cytochrome c-type biogenesis protein CcmH/NrfF
MSMPNGGQWEVAIGLLVLGFLVWELRSLRRTQREDREKARQAEAKPPE